MNRLKDKTVVITGAAQGFGEGIARCLVGEGANVVIADLNYELAQKTAKKLGGWPCAVDVTDEAKVKALIDAVMERFGRLDVFISNAGILKAGSLDEMTLESFELVTKVNYTAFFLCAKYASAAMKLLPLFSWPKRSPRSQRNRAKLRLSFGVSAPATARVCRRRASRRNRCPCSAGGSQ
jgi:NAD(P)-dependent dehydrogenase (short-subunit alcohol dehydrogenase family)